MKILFLASEVHPFSKTGGLGDVAHSLPAALAALGHEVLVVTPLYGALRERERLEPLHVRLPLTFPAGAFPADLHRVQVGERHQVLFLGNDALFGQRAGLYGEAGGDYGDNALRFAFLSVGALTAAQVLRFHPDVVHLNDWQTGLAAVALLGAYAEGPLGRARSVLTIHNLAYQGWFPKGQMDVLGLPWELFTPDGLEFYDQVNFLKAGLVYADALTTVSPSYAREVQTPEGGEGLHGLLRQRAGALTGILNGIDTEAWDPATDRHLPAHYSREDLSGREACRRALLARFAMPEDAPEPLFGVVSRFAGQKGMDLVLEVLPALLSEGRARLAVVGSGDPALETAFRVLAARFPDRVGLRLGYDEPLSHLVEAGADFFLMPSRYEPCGLNQMYSLAYGCVPVVRSVGGLADSVTDLAQPDGTGIRFDAFSGPAFLRALERALALHADPARMREVRLRGMAQDFSWGRSARAYESLYRRLVEAG
jgi:starch synthase